MAETTSAIDIAQALKGMTFPAKREVLVKHAKDRGADDKVLEALKNLPHTEYDSMAGVEQAYSQERS